MSRSSSLVVTRNRLQSNIRVGYRVGNGSLFNVRVGNRPRKSIGARHGESGEGFEAVRGESTGGHR